MSDAIEGASCRLAPTREQVERRGMAWVIGAFLICPCHLPLTLALAASLLGGTALGVAVRGNPIVAGTIISVVWLAATWRGVHLVGAARMVAARAQADPTRAAMGGAEVSGGLGSRADR